MQQLQSSRTCNFSLGSHHLHQARARGRGIVVGMGFDVQYCSSEAGLQLFLLQSKFDNVDPELQGPEGKWCPVVLSEQVDCRG